MKRRSFLKGTAAALAAGTLGRRVLAADAGPRVAVVRGPTEAALRRAVALVGGIGTFVKPGQKVLLKPNASFSTGPDVGANTSPEAVRAMVRLCLTEGKAKQVIVLDHTLRPPDTCFERSGIKAACADLKGCHLVGLEDKRFFVDTPIPGGKVLKHTAIAKDVLEADVLISLPTAKSHSATGVSLGLKGLMGLIWDRKTFHRDMDLNEAVADLATVIPTRLTVVDASRALASGGPGGPGETVRLDTIVASIDPLAADAKAVTLTPWYGRKFKGKQVRHLAAAAGRGLGEIDPRRWQVVEERVS